jgi:carboxyl-terminal processing protease
MKRWTRILPVLVIAAAGVGFLAAPAIRGVDATGETELAAPFEDQQSSFRELSEQDRLIGAILTEIYRNYYQEVDVSDVAVGALKGMMRQLDPYSEFYVEESDAGEVADLENTITGSYSGIGATIINRTGSDLSIVAPMKVSPAIRAGLLAGDIIFRIDGEPSRHYSASQAASRIKGPKGTPVRLTVLREGFPEPFDISIVRDTIEVNDVSAAVFAAPGIAYIEIARFSRNTGRFLLEAIDKLEREQKVEGMILDLRGNPGGLLDEALSVLEPLMPPDELVVYTRGRMRQMNSEFRTSEPQRFGGRLAILVNGASASASEIVAGAVQDLDRGVIVGKQTFGKGLIQQIAQLKEGQYLRLTTGEYFTPSGRSLQRPFARDTGGLLTIRNPSAPDTTEHPVYTSRAGREVTGGGGVVPDIDAETITGNVLLFRLKFIDSMFLRYVNNYVNTRGLEEGARVTVDAALLEDYRLWVQEQDFTDPAPTEMLLDDLRRLAEVEEIDDSVDDEIDALEAAIAREKMRMWQQSRDKIALELRREFVTRLEGYELGQLTSMEEDAQFQAALKVLQDTSNYAGILAGKAMGMEVGGGS